MLQFLCLTYRALTVSDLMTEYIQTHAGLLKNTLIFLMSFDSLTFLFFLMPSCPSVSVGLLVHSESVA